MTKTFRALTFCLILMTLATNFSQTVAADEIVGIMYRIGYKDKKGKKIWVGSFRATPNGKLWNHPKGGGKPRVIGFWTGNEENTKATVNGFTEADGHLQKFNGNYEIVLVGLNPRTWEGTYTHPTTGMKRPMLVEVIKD